MISTIQPAAYITAALCAAHSVRRVIVSPGTRCAPLVEAFAARKEFKITTVVDERTAAFIALGMATIDLAPTVLICTSGTAVLNYSPAVAEAYYRGIPLIVISADRPSRWIDQDDGQTIRQSGVLSPIVRGSYDITSDTESRDFAVTVGRIVNDALLTANQGISRGPVHINIRFDAPLGQYRTIDEKELRICPVKGYFPIPRLSRDCIVRMATKLKGKKVMVIVGTCTPDAGLIKSLKRLTTVSGIVVVYEAQSGLRGVDGVGVIEAVLASLTEAEKLEYAPNYVISIGGSVVSQNLKSWLRNLPILQHWYIGTEVEKGLVDCYQHLTATIRADASHMLRGIAGAMSRFESSSIAESFTDFWLQRSRSVFQSIAAIVDRYEWCDLLAVKTLIENLPNTVNLQVSNGMSIRYVQLCDYTRLHRLDCNRGVSGIDGSTSTAVGAAINSSRTTILLTGDTSLDYDLSVLNTGLVPNRFALFVLNNAGGNIFRVIENTRHLPTMENHMAVRRMRNYRDIAAAFGFEYVRVSDIADLVRITRNIESPRNRPLFVEVDTVHSDNAHAYRHLIQCLRGGIGHI